METEKLGTSCSETHEYLDSKGLSGAALEDAVKSLGPVRHKNRDAVLRGIRASAGLDPYVELRYKPWRELCRQL